MIVAQSHGHAMPRSFVDPNIEGQIEQRDLRPSVYAGDRGPRAERTRGMQAFYPSPSIPSQPMVIPTRSRNGARKTTRHRQSSGEENGSSSEIDYDEARSKSGAEKSASYQRRRMTDSGTQNIVIKSNKSAKQRTSLNPRSLSSSSPKTWDLLLSPPQDIESDCGSFDDDLVTGIGSVSAESTPSLLDDDGSTISTSTPSTSGFPAGVRGEKRNKNLSASIGEDCLFTHPLRSDKLPEVLDENSWQESINTVDSIATTKTTRSFKSNLSASIRAIRSAARSLSDLAPPIREDHLSRSLLSLNLPYTTERHPLSPQYHEPPTASPSNFIPVTLHPPDLHIHHDEPASTSPPCPSAIQLQSCTPGLRRSPHASSPPIFHGTQSSFSTDSKPYPELNALDTEDPKTTNTQISDLGNDSNSVSAATPRQREPRENADFLRVIVLEMNMRKCGKLGEREPGRARLWLPARKAEIGNRTTSTMSVPVSAPLPTRTPAMAASTEEGNIPLRWREWG